MGESMNNSSSGNNMLSVARNFVSQRLAFYASALPAILELSLLFGLFVVGNAVIYRRYRVKHSASLLSRGPFSVGGEREKPLEHNAKKFFQNQHGLWIHYCVWKPENIDISPKTASPVSSDVKGVIVFLHGHSEHVNRHEHITQFFVENGYVVFGMDHQGFGRSEGDRGHVEDFHHYVDDVTLFFQDVLLEMYPNLVELPKFVMAHSMGGLIGILTALRFQNIVADETLQMQDVDRNEYKRKDPRHHSLSIEERKKLFTLSGVVIGSPALHVSPLTRNPVVMTGLRLLAFLFPKAPLIGFPSAPSTTFLQTKQHSMLDPLNYHENMKPHQVVEMVDACNFALNNAQKFKTPILLFHGVEDATTNISGSRIFFSKISTAATDRLMLELPGMMHEPMQESWEVRKPLMEKVLKWLSTRVGK